jgi:enoyl-CoA hydratase/carnithine racemase
MIAIIRKAVPMYKFEEMQYTGERVTAEECEAHHIVLKACHRDELMDEALSFAKGLRKRREVMAEMKKRLYKDIVHSIEIEDPPLIESGTFYVQAD